MRREGRLFIEGYREMKLRAVSAIMLSLLLIGMLTLAFDIQPVEASGTIYIRADGSVDPEPAPISTVDNVTYTFTDNIYDEIVVERDNIVVDGAGYTLQGIGVINSVGIGLTERNNVTIRNMEITEFYYGIGLWDSSINTISGNKITANNEDGIYLDNSSINTISGNNVANNYRGIWLSRSSNNNIVGNNITANNWDGITLYDSSYNSICGNNITANYRDGIGLYASSSINNIQRNNMVNNQHDGIGLYAFSNHNSICENNIANNYGSIWLSESSFTSIYHNNFVNNTERAATLSSVLNVWDDGYPSGGNYWSNYNGTDDNQDGIGDSPYTIDANNQDNYPLMGMFHDFSVEIELVQICHVYVISNSTVSNLEVRVWLTSANEYLQPGDEFIYYVVDGEEGSVGFCRIMVPRVVLNDSYVVLVDWHEVSATELPFSNSTHAYLYFTYNHSTHEVVIVPEFPSSLLLPLFMIVTLLAVIIYRRKHSG